MNIFKRIRRTNLTVGDVTNLMEFGEYAIIVNEPAKQAKSGYPYMQPPSALYFDKNDDGILKSTPYGQIVMMGKVEKNVKGDIHLYKIISAEEFDEYLEKCHEKNN